MDLKTMPMAQLMIRVADLYARKQDRGRVNIDPAAERAEFIASLHELHERQRAGATELVGPEEIAAAVQRRKQGNGID